MAFVAYSQAFWIPQSYIPEMSLRVGGIMPTIPHVFPRTFSVIPGASFLTHQTVGYTEIPGEAKYLAINRGALHEAPLPGHKLSQTMLNLAPAA